MGFFDFFKGKEDYQVSDYLLNHPLKDKYFFRLMPFRSTGDYKVMVVAIDPNSPRFITFDPWPQIIFFGSNRLENHTSIYH